MPTLQTERLFTVSLQGGGTGEGVSVWAMLVVAGSAEDAVTRFWHVCFRSDPEAQAYYGYGLNVTAGFDRTKFRGHTTDFLDRLETQALRSGAFAYQTYWHFNLS